MTCPFFLFLFLFPLLCSVSVCLSVRPSVCLSCMFVCLPLWLTDANTPKKCRALFGLDQLSLWCKPCRYITAVNGGRRPQGAASTPRLFFFFTPLVSVSIGALTDGKTLSAAPPARRGASCYKFFLTAIFFLLAELSSSPMAENGFLNKNNFRVFPPR